MIKHRKVFQDRRHTTHVIRMRMSGNDQIQLFNPMTSEIFAHRFLSRMLSCVNQQIVAALPHQDTIRIAYVDKMHLQFVFGNRTRLWYTHPRKDIRPTIESDAGNGSKQLNQQTNNTKAGGKNHPSLLLLLQIYFTACSHFVPRF